LLDIAKGYNLKIKEVFFCLPELIENNKGMVFASKSPEKYRILLDENLLFCANQVLFTFFHEVGHIILKHLIRTEVERFIFKLDWEKAANEWAFNQMGIVDQQGQVKGNAHCLECIKCFSRKCLRGFK